MRRHVSRVMQLQNKKEMCARKNDAKKRQLKQQGKAE